jgi:predicted dehydrogenase
MAVSLEQCDRMIETTNRFGAKLAVNHQMRFMEQYSIPKRMFAEEAYGGLTSMTVVAGNFGFSMNGSHYFEAFRYLTDDDPCEVTAWFSDEMVPNPRGPQFQDRAGSIRAVTASGKRLYMDIGADQGHGVHVVYGGRNGTVTVNELSGELLSEVREEQYRDLPTTRYGMPSVGTRLNIQTPGLFDSSAAVLMALLNGENNPSGEDGRRVIALLVAAYESAEQGGVPVRVDGSLDRNRVFPWA